MISVRLGAREKGKTNTFINFKCNQLTGSQKLLLVFVSRQITFSLAFPTFCATVAEAGPGCEGAGEASTTISFHV